ncbi:hypothetical protein CTA2_456 [Colletotrichum tanaceti]|uniref:DUF7703 domain-containing protein n=1 Tax=Colletotrichum tanaceti TaxID=1306861 RepID=A0A4U6XBV8_9PEZI|nr:hypothetical protein CTA2_456 [Colletotrichum tanaceti]TKW52562.1 hypothetical protein CTA1_13411 [Colletotrichum tanaceti]
MATSIKGAIELTRPEAMAMAALATAGIYNAVEIYILIFTTFRHRRGRYFWSMFVANAGILTHAVASLARYLSRHGNVVPGAFAMLGWCAMVTGQSVVLWSRLHLVVYSRTWTRLVLALIGFNACALHLPMATMWALCWASPAPAQQQAWIARYGVYEKVSIVVFTLQETLISGIFARQGFFNLRPLFPFKTRAARSMSWCLLGLFVLVFLLDLGLVVLEYTDHFVYQTTSKPLVYSIKLKVEFAVLNRLLAFTTMNSCDRHHLDDRPASYDKAVTTADTTTTKGLARAQGDAVPDALVLDQDTERRDRIFDGSSMTEQRDLHVASRQHSCT